MGLAGARRKMCLCRRNAIICLSLVTSLLSGCGVGDLNDLKEFVADEKAKGSSHVKPLPQPKEYDSFEYDATDLRDPFVPIKHEEENLVATPNSRKGPPQDRRKEELEAYPLDSLRMVGTLKQDDIVWGLVKTSDGSVHRVRAGNYLGQNYGKITLISDVGIELIEFIRDGLEGWIDRKATLAISE
jgi:type IV pilus assembly protein PilP